MVETVGSQIGANRVTVEICRNGSTSLGKVTKYDVRSKSKDMSGSIGKVTILGKK